MLCEKCHQNEATVHLSQTRQGKTVEYNLCEQCAQQQGLSQHISSYLGSIFGQGFGGSIFNTAGGIPAFGNTGISNAVCHSCGQSYEEFRRTGLFGCSKCYSEFAEQLEPVFRRVQGSIRHSGRQLSGAPKRDSATQKSKIEMLRSRLQEAVAAEDYEKAARIRDEIRTLEPKREQKGDGSK